MPPRPVQLVWDIWWRGLSMRSYACEPKYVMFTRVAPAEAVLIRQSLSFSSGTSDRWAPLQELRQSNREGRRDGGTHDTTRHAVSPAPNLRSDDAATRPPGVSSAARAASASACFVAWVQVKGGACQAAKGSTARARAIEVQVGTCSSSCDADEGKRSSRRDSRLKSWVSETL